MTEPEPFVLPIRNREPPAMPAEFGEPAPSMIHVRYLPRIEYEAVRERRQLAVLWPWRPAATENDWCLFLSLTPLANPDRFWMPRRVTHVLSARMGAPAVASVFPGKRGVSTTGTTGRYWRDLARWALEECTSGCALPFRHAIIER